MATKGELALKSLVNVVRATGIHWGSVARGLNVQVKETAKWRSSGKVPKDKIDQVDKWVQKSMHYHTKPEPHEAWDGTWIHTKPEELRAFFAQYAMSYREFARKVHVSESTVKNWANGKTTAIPTNQKKAAKVMAAYIEEQGFLDESFEGRRRRPVQHREGQMLIETMGPPAPTNGAKKPKLSKQERLTNLLFEFAEEDGLSRVDAVLVVADVLRALQTVGKMPS